MFQALGSSVTIALWVPFISMASQDTMNNIPPYYTALRHPENAHLGSIQQHGTLNQNCVKRRPMLNFHS